VEAHAIVAGLLEDTVHAERVQMWMDVHGAAEQLRAADRARLCPDDAGEALDKARDLFAEDPVDGAEHRGLRRRESPQLPWQRENPLADGDVGQDAIDDVRRQVAHPSPAAARTQAAVLARQGDEHIVATAAAATAHKAPPEVSASSTCCATRRGGRWRCRGCRGSRTGALGIGCASRGRTARRTW
jgi:hypothetical protein